MRCTLQTRSPWLPSWRGRPEVGRHPAHYWSQQRIILQSKPRQLQLLFITKTRNFNCRSKLWIFPSSVFMGLRRIKKKFMLLELEFYAKICVFIPEVLLAVQRNTFLDWWLSWFRQGEYIIISSQLDWSLHHRQYHGPHKLRQNVDSDFTVPSDCYLCCLDL